MQTLTLTMLRNLIGAFRGYLWFYMPLAAAQIRDRAGCEPVVGGPVGRVRRSELTTLED